MNYTRTLIGLNIAIFLIEFALGDGFVKLFAFTPALVMRQPWMFVTAMFLHSGVLHLMFNMIALLFFGPLLEQRLGSKNFLAFYMVGGIIGNIGYYLTAPGANVPGLGASGAIYAVLGAMAVFEPNMTVFVGFFPLPMYLAAVFWFFTEFIYLGGTDLIGHGAHLVGLVFGLAVAFYLKRQAERKLRFIGGPF